MDYSDLLNKLCIVLPPVNALAKLRLHVNVGKSLGATSYAQRKNKKTKIPDSQKDVRRRAKIGAKNPQNTKLRIEIVLPREIVYPCFLADP